jgi:hypothetical protein
VTIEQRPAAIYQDLFCHRRDVYAEQTPDGAYFVRRSPITDRLIIAHLSGRITAGFYALQPDGTCRWAVLDADLEDGLEQLQGAWSSLQQRGLPSYLERSRRGGHLWLFFAEPVPARAARQLVLGAVPTMDGQELFPKQDQLDRTHPLGSLVRGPLGIHQVTGQRYPFVDPISRSPVASSMRAMVDYLREAERGSLAQVADVLARLLVEQQVVPPSGRPDGRAIAPRPARRGSPLERAKERIGDTYSFVSRFVDLDPSGRGHCPFHPPDHHPSFVVSRVLDRWTCFHEYSDELGRYLGGDGIDFYMRLKGLDYREALDELRGV